MNELSYIVITNTETGRHLIAIEQDAKSYVVALTPIDILEAVPKRSIGKRIRTFMKEKNGKQEKTNR